MSTWSDEKLIQIDLKVDKILERGCTWPKKEAELIKERRLKMRQYSKLLKKIKDYEKVLESIAEYSIEPEICFCKHRRGESCSICENPQPEQDRTQNNIASEALEKHRSKK